LITLQVYYR